MWLELDRGTEKIKVWKIKITALINYIHTRYEKDFNTPVVTVAVVVPFEVPNREHRVKELRSWTEQQLITMQQEHEYDLFRFIALPEAIEAEALYLSSCWERPFSKGKYRLLEL